MISGEGGVEGGGWGGEFSELLCLLFSESVLEESGAPSPPHPGTVPAVSSPVPSGPHSSGHICIDALICKYGDTTVVSFQRHL